MVGEEVLELSSEVSALQQGEGETWPLTPNGYFQQRPHLSELSVHLARARRKHSNPDLVTMLIGQCKNYRAFPDMGTSILLTIDRIEGKAPR